MRDALRLAYHYRCTLAELNARMSSDEMTYHLALLAGDGTAPQALPVQWAHLMAAAYSGPMTRVDKGKWLPEHFLKQPWVQAVEQPQRELTLADFKAAAAANGMRGPRHVNG